MTTTTTRNALLIHAAADINFPYNTNTNMQAIDAAIAKCNYAAATDPAVGDDSADGYAVGSMWYNTTAHRLFTCESNGAGAASWRQIWPALLADQTLAADWDAGNYEIRAKTFESDVATGTAPLTIASTTKVSNLNADKLDDQEGSYYAVATEAANGWLASGETWTYAASDAPSYTFTISGDKSTKYYAGMRVKLTDSTVAYFIITKVAYSEPNTTVTIYGGTDYTLTGGAITLPFYSMVKAPAGFPLDPAKWTETHADSSSRVQANPTASTWYNVGTTNNQLSLPIGAWYVEYNAIAQVNINTVPDLYVTISTANNTESNPLSTKKLYLPGMSTFGFAANGGDTFVVTTKTTLYLNEKNGGEITAGEICFYGDQSPTTIKAVSAYL